MAGWRSSFTPHSRAVMFTYPARYAIYNKKYNNAKFYTKSWDSQKTTTSHSRYRSSTESNECKAVVKTYGNFFHPHRTDDSVLRNDSYKMNALKSVQSLWWVGEWALMRSHVNMRALVPAWQNASAQRRHAPAPVCCFLRKWQLMGNWIWASQVPLTCATCHTRRTCVAIHISYLPTYLRCIGRCIDS